MLKIIKERDDKLIVKRFFQDYYLTGYVLVIFGVIFSFLALTADDQSFSKASYLFPFGFLIIGVYFILLGGHKEVVFDKRRSTVDIKENRNIKKTEKNYNLKELQYIKKRKSYRGKGITINMYYLVFIKETVLFYKETDKKAISLSSSKNNSSNKILEVAEFLNVEIVE